VFIGLRKTSQVFGKRKLDDLKKKGRSLWVSVLVEK